MTEKKIIFFEGDDNTDNITRKGVVESLNMNGISEYDDQWSNFATLYKNNENFIQKEIKQKISSYTQQDKLKERIKEDTQIINSSDVIELIKETRLSCYYCGIGVKMIYTTKYDKFQWTLDRIDNSLAHTKDNVVISCLKCNLQKRARNHEKFDFTKKLVIKKCD